MNLATRLALASAWAMEEPALRQLLEIAHREHEITPQALEAYRAASLEGADAATVRDGVAILTATGPLFKRANMMTALSGATSYDVLMRDFTTALDDGNVKAILWNIDSPGGEASGCAELASTIFSARGRKPIVAYAGDLVASAAYWIATACDQIFIGQGAAVGSIGVRATLSDTSVRDARSGVRTFDFVSSQSPFKVSDPATEDGAGRIQARVDALATVFIASVAANRGVSVPRVRDNFGRGDVLIGQAAVDAGMVDGLASFEAVLARLAKANSPSALAFFRVTGKAADAPTSAADSEFALVRAAALARIANEKAVQAAADEERAAAKRESDAAVTAILTVMKAAHGHSGTR